MVRSTPLRSDPGRVINTSMDSLDTQCGYVWNGYTLCTRLQAFAKPHFFLIILILQGILQGAAGTFFIKTLLSTKLGLSYTTTRWMILGSETVVLILAIPIIYWGSERRRPGWLAGLTFIFSVCSIIFASQVLSEHSSRSEYSYSNSRVSDLCQPWNQSYWFGANKWNWITAIMIVVLHYAMGLHSIGYWAFGIGYIDDNTSNNMSPLFIGIALALRQFGPFIGLFISSYSTTTTLMGVYWLIVGGTGLLIATLIGMFPKKLTGPVVQQTGDPGLIPALTRVFTNKIIIFSWLATINLLTFALNAAALEEKYVESTFYITRSSLYDTLFSIQYLFGILKPTVAAISMLISGIIIHRMKPRALFLCIWSIISICVAAGAIFAIIFLKCSATPIHKEQSRSDLEEYCNVNCRCSEDLPFMPTCSQYYGFVYYSPCHAGCTTSYTLGNTKVYSNCSCVPTGTVEVGHCSGGNCRIYWWLYEILVLIVIAFFSSGIIGNLLICFRSVLPSDRTIMIGVIFTVSTFIANVPHKILYDLVANWSCMYFVDSQCKIYNSDKLATFINLFNICMLLLSAGMLTVVCFMVQDLPLYNNQSAAKINSESMTEMSDFRTQLNQALRTRRESAAEEQKLLSEPTTQTSHLRGHENGNRASFIEEDAKQKSSIDGQKRLTLQKPLIPTKSSVLQEDKSSGISSLNSIPASSQLHSAGPSPTAPMKNQQRPPVPVKSAALVNEMKASLSSSSINSSPPSTPTHSSGTTVRTQGYLTTLL